MTRVMIFSTDDHLVPAGGAEQAFGNITKRLPEIEFDLICAKLRKGALGYEKVGNVHIHRMGFGIPKLDGVILALFGQYCAYKLMKKHEYQLLWSIMASYGAFAAVRVKKKTGVPLLLTLQEGDSFQYIYNKVRFVRSAFNNIFKSADGIQAISHYLLRWGKEMGYKGALGRVIPNGVSVELFTQNFSSEEVQSMRTSFGFPQDALILFTSSRLEIKNGVTDVVSALAVLPPHVCFVVCGSGSLQESIQSQVAAQGLQNRVKFMGFIDPKELPLLMRASDIFIRPSLSEGLGNAFLEAMASGLVTVGTNAGGIPDFLTDGETGFLVEIENPQSIVDTVLKTESLHESTKEAIVARAKALVLEKYNWDVVTKDIRSLFKDIVETT
jgi:glycosyltransferase involved in cell wall biosynthesis